MSSVTTWRRLEPRTRDDRLPGLAARIADPLWLLGRQWQTGELAGADRGSPVAVTVIHEALPLTHWAPGTSRGRQRSLPKGVPLQAIVDPVPAVVSVLDRAIAGQRFLEMLAAVPSAPTGLVQRLSRPLRGSFTLPQAADLPPGLLDAGSRPTVALLARRGIDGASLRRSLGTGGTPNVPSFVTNPDDVRAFQAAAALYRTWWDARYPAGKGAWEASQLAAPFRVGASTDQGALTLTAPDHRGADLDWHSFERVGRPSTGAKRAVTPATFKTLPTNLTYAGMPANRWWQYEDAAVDIGQLDAGPDDLTKVLMAEYGLLYGNDHFVVGLRVPVGSVSRIKSLTVQTNFGDTVTVPSAASFDAASPQDGRWQMFTVTSDQPGLEDGALVIIPGAVAPVTGPIAEEIHLTPDEMANVVWAIERRVRGLLGTPVERQHVDEARNSNVSGPPAGARARYLMSTTVPDSWNALTRNRSGTTLSLAAADQGLGALLGSGSFVFEAVQLPRSGLKVTLRSQRARGTDGQTFAWWSWTTSPGRGESGSGLRHDIVKYS